MTQQQCINCAACAMFAPNVFQRNKSDRHHVVYHQPETDQDVDDARAALVACPVAAIRVETNAHRNHRNLQALTPTEQELASKLAINPKFNGLEKPFPRPMTMVATTTTTSTTIETTDSSDKNNNNNVYYVGHHNEKSFGAVPYLVYSESADGWIMVDTPKYTKAAKDAVTSITGPDGPKYLLLTHVDDTEGHDKWVSEADGGFPKLQRIFHSGDLGPNNWRRDEELNNVEILLHERSTEDKLQFFTIDGKPVDYNNNDNNKNGDDVYIIHTPGHSPGSITLWKRPTEQYPMGILFTGDTYAYTTRDNGKMSGFPRYGNDRSLQAKILPQLLALEWQTIAAGHGHPRMYTNQEIMDGIHKQEMQVAQKELASWARYY